MNNIEILLTDLGMSFEQFVSGCWVWEGGVFRPSLLVQTFLGWLVFCRLVSASFRAHADRVHRILIHFVDFHVVKQHIIHLLRGLLLRGCVHLLFGLHGLEQRPGELEGGLLRTRLLLVRTLRRLLAAFLQEQQQEILKFDGRKI